jgi:hypothetical protein
VSDVTGLERALSRVRTLAEGVGRRTTVIGTVVLLAAVTAWAILLRRWAFDSFGAFVAWLPLLGGMAIPGLVLRGFGTRVQRLGGDIDRIARDAGVALDELHSDGRAAVARTRRGGLRSLLSSLRELGRHGDRMRDLVADAAGTARIVALPYLTLVGGSILGAAVVLVLVLIALGTLAL